MDISCKVTVPKEVFDLKAFLKANEDGLDWLVRETHKDFAATSRSAKFEEERAHEEGGALVARCGTDSEKYAWVNDGTPARVITPGAGKGPMVFQPGYTPATVPGHIGHGTAVRSGPKLVRAKVGTRKPHSITPRKFDETIAEKRAPDLERIGVKAVEAGMK